MFHFQLSRRFKSLVLLSDEVFPFWSLFGNISMKQSSTKFYRILHFRREEDRQQGRGGGLPEQPRGGRHGVWGECAICACAGPLWVPRLGVGCAGEHERAGPPGQVQGDERSQQAGGQAPPHRGGEGHRHPPAQRWAHHLTMQQWSHKLLRNQGATVLLVILAPCAQHAVDRTQSDCVLSI